MIQIELTKKDRCYIARARIYGQIRCKSPKFRKWSAAIDYCVAWLQTNWKDEVLWCQLTSANTSDDNSRKSSNALNANVLVNVRRKRETSFFVNIHRSNKMSSTTILIAIYCLMVPLLLALLWSVRRRRTPQFRTRWLAESMTFFNTRSTMVIDYWKNSKFQPK